jgi:hypothetical protein
MVYIHGMATEVLNVPEDKLEEVIKVIRAGLRTTKVSKETKKALTTWCDEEEEYLERLNEED